MVANSVKKEENKDLDTMTVAMFTSNPHVTPCKLMLFNRGDERDSSWSGPILHEMVPLHPNQEPTKLLNVFTISTDFVFIVLNKIMAFINKGTI